MSPLGEDNPTCRLDDKVAALRSPTAYEERPTTIEAIETHFAWVFLTDRHAFKLKKPVRTDFLDFSTLDARRFNCLEEFRLNQRLAPGVYLGVVPLTLQADGTLRVGGEGVAVDWLVKMRRLPTALMLDRLIPAGGASYERLSALGRMLGEFYRMQSCIEFDPRDYVRRIRLQMEQDRIDLLAPDLGLSVSLVESTVTAQASACEVMESALMLRARERRIVEAHGDLRPEHICLTEPPCIIDCLEFSLDLRTLDPAEELAFLWVECERLGDALAGETVLSGYLAESGDPVSTPLLDFYRSRRASVRAKIVAWHLRDPAVAERTDWRAQAEDYVALARSFAQQAMGAHCD